jgi:glycosyltransferase involved in cell wall biosynthesis
MKVLQISSSEMRFFGDQVRILEEQGIECDVVCYTKGSLRKDKHSDSDGLTSGVINRIYGHNPAYYAYRAGSFYPDILTESLASEYDVIHVNSGMVAPLGLAQPQRPVVLTLWGDDLLGDRLYGLQSRITTLCARMSDSVIVRSEEMRQALPRDAHIIPSGVDMEKFSPVDRETARERIGWEADAHHVVFPYPPNQTKKRYPAAQQIAADVDSELDRDIALQVVKGVPHDRMYLYYSAADALLLPSLREGSPNPVKESMACNLPVVTRDVGDVRTRLGPVSNSHVCSTDTELKEALVRVLESEERSDGREHVTDVSLKRMGERIVAIYESLLTEGPEAPEEADRR